MQATTSTPGLYARGTRASAGLRPLPAARLAEPVALRALSWRKLETTSVAHQVCAPMAGATLRFDASFESGNLAEARLVSEMP